MFDTPYRLIICINGGNGSIGVTGARANAKNIACMGGRLRAGFCINNFVIQEERYLFGTDVAVLVEFLV